MMTQPVFFLLAPFIRRPKTEKFRKGLAYNGPQKWKELPFDLHQAEDKWVFKRAAANWINQTALKSSELPAVAYEDC